MKKLLLVIVVLLSAGAAIAQVPAIQWQKSLGGGGTDIANSIQQTNDGGYIVAGYSSSTDGNITGNHGGYDYWIVKLDGSGNIVWQKSLGGGNTDIANSIQQTNDGGYIVAGYSSSTDGDITGNHGVEDYWIVKLNGSGNIVWQKSLGGSGTDHANSIQQTSDGGYIVAGYSTSLNGDVTGNHGFGVDNDYWVVKLDGSGNIIWQKSLGGPGADFASAIQQTNDGGYIVAGSSYSNTGDVSGNHGGYDYWVVKLDGSGNILWQKAMGGSDDDDAYSIQQTNDGGYVVAGQAKSSDGDVSGSHGYDAWVVKLDVSGNIVWQKALGGSGTDRANAVQQTSDGGYIVAGYSSSNDGDVTNNYGIIDYWVVKLDASATIVWQKSLGGSDIDFANSIRPTIDGGYIVTGYSKSTDTDVSGNHGNEDYWVVKFGVGTLPLHLLSFSALKQNENALLQWQTSDEINTSHFEIERSTDALAFTKIGSINAANNSGTQHYNFTDIAPAKGINYYQLKQVDKDDRYTYSTIAKVVFEKDAAALLAFPNPAGNTTSIQYTGDQKKIQLAIFDLAGRQVMFKELNNQSIWQANVSGLAKGTYTIRLNDGAKQSFVKLVKL